MGGWGLIRGREREGRITRAAPRDIQFSALRGAPHQLPPRHGRSYRRAAINRGRRFCPDAQPDISAGESFDHAVVAKRYSRHFYTRVCIPDEADDISRMLLRRVDVEWS